MIVGASNQGFIITKRQKEKGTTIPGEIHTRPWIRKEEQMVYDKMAKVEEWKRLSISALGISSSPSSFSD